MAKSIMIQGTMSNAGKSLFVAALCRIFKQDGYKVAPFKSQNMALNSFITKDGFEMGRAQVMQAEAAGIEPSVRMNPILLKPTTDVGSQVIVNGESIGNMKAVDYFKYKKALIPQIMEAYNALAAEYDIIVIEGAGSPAEINLKSEDIVNMGMARLAKAPVLLVGDIDRGGVFAQLLGTIMLLEESEKAMLKGLVINKFRGDRSILQSGLDMLEDMGKKPVVGVVPYVYVDIDDEDSLSERLSPNKSAGVIDIVVIKLPRISNFTDFDVFGRFSGVSVRYVSNVNQLKDPDLIILPGTKSTISDLKWLRQNGLEATIKKLHAKGIPIFGICGGYQMLGKKIRDPLNTEGGGEIDGIGFIAMETVFREEKTRTQIQGKFVKVGGDLSLLSECCFKGYEIHMGMSKGADDIDKLTCSDNEKTDGAYVNNVYGTYIHGILDNNEVSTAIVKALYAKKGIDFMQDNAISMEEYKNMQYDKLANEVRESIDMKLIYKILDEGI